MRAALLKRRRRGPSLPADVLALLQADPTVVIQLKYNFLAGRYVLFQDAACTVPVEEEGDPIGGVIQPSLVLPPEEWTIAAVQDTDAARPTWGGEEVGAEFDGENDHLVFVPSFADWTAAHLFVGLRLTAFPPAGGETGLWSLNPGATNDSAVPFTDSNIYDGAFADPRAGGVAAGVDMSTAFHAYEVASDASSYDQRMNGNLLQSSTARFASPRSVNELGYSRTTAAGIRRLNGRISVFAGFDRRISDSDAAVVRSSVIEGMI